MRAQSNANPGNLPASAVSPQANAAPAPPVVKYTRPAQGFKLRSYLFDAFGPYAIAGAAASAGFDQERNIPSEWGRGASGYGDRFLSNLAVGAITTTARYGLAQAFREDTVYYRCECKKLFPRLGHAVISTVTGRRGEDGHRSFSLPAIASPYAGSMTAVYAWYPERFNYNDGLRMGSYTLLTIMAENIAREFIYGGPHTLLKNLNLPSPSEGDPTTSSKPSDKP